MIALDTNILIALHRSDAPGHAVATQAYHDAGGDHAPWALPWPCVHEFIGIATHARIFAPPSTLAQAVEVIARWQTRPAVHFLHEDETYWSELTRLLAGAGITGPRIHDARIAALCLHHGVRELWTADRDFSRFPRLRTRNPLVPA
jgi:toxin-antitoxin system PIN domain toxin